MASRFSSDLEHGSEKTMPPPLVGSEDDSMEKSSIDQYPDDLAEAQPSAEDDFPEGGLRAWLIVAATACILFCNFGYANAFGVYQEYYTTHILSDQTPSNISWIGSIQLFLQFGGMLVGGPLFDQYGAKIIWPPILTYLISVFMTSLCTKLWQFMLCQGILGGFSMGLSMGPAFAASTHYFRRKRGAAMGLAIAGSSVGGVIFPIALSKMLYNSNLGFGWTVRIIGFLMLGILLPSACVIRARLPPRKGHFFLLKAFKEPLYVCIVVSVSIMMLGMFTPFFYLPTYAVEHGVSPQLASYLVAILNGASFFGRVVPGILADKLGPLNILFCAAIAASVLIFSWQAMTTTSAIIAFSVLYGFFSGAIISLMSLSVANVPRNPQNIGTYMGMGMALSAIATLIGPPINGALVTKYGGFKQSQDMSGAFVLVGAFGILLARHFAGKRFWAKV